MRNNFIIKDDVVIIYIYRRKENKFFECIIDKNDFELIDFYDVTWYPKWSYKAKRFYVGASQYLGKAEGKPKYKMLYLHRILLNCKKFGEWADHIDHDPLNNRMNNLRILTSSENGRHRERKNSNNVSGHRNVANINGSYVVQMQIDGKNAKLGSFDNIEEAGDFAEEMRKKYYGEFSGEDKL